ncbi:hypothetical protein F2Q70_00037284 [Brassica cretica]|uniref:Uncharacterized protein n=1 Tax=Brassica cretica TaxID=69181 RepID=A0A8S9JP80_BRACR|nr:hypothetical protein F2Q70_00037284 [Brassica cretica]
MEPEIAHPVASCSTALKALTAVMEVAVAEGAERLAERGRKCKEYAAEMFTASKMALAYERLFLCIKDQRFCIYP